MIISLLLFDPTCLPAFTTRILEAHFYMLQLPDDNKQPLNDNKTHGTINGTPRLTRLVGLAQAADSKHVRSRSGTWKIQSMKSQNPPPKCFLVECLVPIKGSHSQPLQIHHFRAFPLSLLCSSQLPRAWGRAADRGIPVQSVGQPHQFPKDVILQDHWQQFVEIHSRTELLRISSTNK